MNMSFWLESSVMTFIIILVLFISWKIKNNEEKYINFFKKHKNVLSPNCISNWRKYGGIPTMLMYTIGFITQNPALIYTSIWIFAFLGITDLLDGIVARACDMVTKTGAKLDAEADKWFDLPALVNLSLVPLLIIFFEISIDIIFTPIYIVFILGIIIFDIIGQKIRGVNSPVEAGIIGKAKTTLKFITIYFMSINGRYPEAYDILILETVILILLIIAMILAGLSMGMKTKWYRDYIRKYLEEYFT